MKLKSINIFGTTYKIKELDLGGSTCGLCSFDKKEIYINKNLSTKEKEVTFWHEVLHAMFYELSINQSVDNQLEEIIVDNAAKLIVGLKEQNNKQIKKRRAKARRS